MPIIKINLDLFLSVKMPLRDQEDLAAARERAEAWVERFRQACMASKRDLPEDCDWVGDDRIHVADLDALETALEDPDPIEFARECEEGDAQESAVIRREDQAWDDAQRRADITP